MVTPLVAYFKKLVIEHLTQRKWVKLVTVRYFIWTRFERNGLSWAAVALFFFGWSAARLLNQLQGMRNPLHGEPAAHPISTNFILILGFISLARGSYGLFGKFASLDNANRKQQMKVVNAFEVIRTALVDPTDLYRLDDRTVSGDPILRSDKIDALLLSEISQPVEVVENSNKRFRQEYGDDLVGLSALLTKKARDSEGSHLYNQAKVSLRDDLLLPSEKGDDRQGGAVLIAKTSYFRTVITNYAATSILEMFGGRQKHDLTHLYPAQNGRIMPLGKTVLSNQIGVSTICLYAGRYVVLLVQGRGTLVNQGRLAPSGSGSMDWSDYTWLRANNRKVELRDLIDKATLRELCEETRAPAEVQAASENLVIGYFRYMREGGLPEFISISKTTRRQHQVQRVQNTEIKKPIVFGPLDGTVASVILCCEEMRTYSGATMQVVVLASQIISILRGELGERAQMKVQRFWSLH